MLRTHHEGPSGYIRNGSATMSSIIGNDDINKQLTVVTVILHIEKKLKFVKYKISKVTVEKTLIKEVTDFMYIHLPILKG